MSEPDPALAVYLVMESATDKRVLAAYPFCLAAGDVGASSVADVSGLSVREVTAALDRLRKLRLITEDGISDWAKRVLVGEVRGRYIKPSTKDRERK